MLEVLFPVLFLGVLAGLFWWTRRNSMEGRNADGTRTESTGDDADGDGRSDDDRPGRE